VSIACAMGTAHADAIEDFYRGKTIRMYINSTLGAGYDVYARLVRVVHEPAHIAFTTSTYKDTYRNIRETGQFVVNLAKFDRAQLEKACILGLTFAPRRERAREGRPHRAAFHAREAAAHRGMPSPLRMRSGVDEALGRPGDDRRQCAGRFRRRRLRRRARLIIWEKVRPVQYAGAPYQRYVDQPPYEHVFAASYETMSVRTPYDGPEIEAHSKIVKDEVHFR